jgi:hypothetical protein
MAMKKITVGWSRLLNNVVGLILKSQPIGYCITCCKSSTRLISLCVLSSRIALLCMLCTPLSAQQCGSWLEALGNSFLPKQVDAKALDELSSLSPETYFASINDAERASVRGTAGEFRNSPQYDSRLRGELKRFYSIGEELYGVHFDSTNFVVRDTAEPNAAASGNYIFFNEGLLLYFLDPINYLQRVGKLPYQLDRNQYAAAAQVFNWSGDWGGIYFVLAHEASHNLMRHRDQQIFERMQVMVGDYRQQIVDRRKDLAEGKSDKRVGRYLWRSTLSFLGTFTQAEKHRDLESEADLVAMVLLRRAGIDPNIALKSAQRMALLTGVGLPSGFSAAMTNALCSSHPDWIARIQNMQSNLGCIQFQGSSCQRRITYPVESVLPDMKKTLAGIERYGRETEDIASGAITSSDFRLVEFSLNPKETQLLVDDQLIPDKKLNLRLGPHKAIAIRNGIQSEVVSFVVYPDVKSKIKLKFKK